MTPCRKGKQICFHGDYGCGSLVSFIGALWGFLLLSMAFGVCEDKVSKL